ncbi:glycosyltransferase family 1 protein [Mariniflexile ostreae]|uniref:Glycosyltransferase family 1 protein n=1 Tax=Mariniflexile ostreae TaxID=1520892 RepID=A0ABV5FES4_9FLAO
MQPIRILQVFTTMGRGGAESMIMNYYRHIDKTKIQFDFLVHREGSAAFDAEIEQLGGVIYRLPEINPIFPQNYYNALREFFKTHHTYKIVHSHLNTFSCFPLKVAEEFNIPVRIAHAHIAMDPINIKTTLKSKANFIEAIKKIIKIQVKKKIHKHSTHRFACGIKAGKWLFGEQMPFKVMNNAINAKTFVYNPSLSEQLKKEFQIDNQTVLGHIGRFTHQKNHEYLIRIFAEVLKINKNFILILIGDGHLDDQIKRLTEKLEVSNQVKFLGLRTNIPELLQLIDIFVFPSFYEGLPVTLIEAQAAGVKILASDTITKEVQLTDDIHYLSIDLKPQYWANTVVSLVPFEKKNNLKQITDGNYDITENALNIENFYIQHYK